MAKLNSPLELNGSFQDMRIYQRKDMKGQIAGMKGGPSKEKLHTAPVFEPIRNQWRDLSRRSALVKMMRPTLEQVKPVVDYNNPQSALQTIFRMVQEAGEAPGKGKRSIILSQNKALLNGFSLNHRNAFDSILTTPPTVSISRESLSVSLQWPSFRPGVNFKPIGDFPAYRIVSTACMIPDMYYGETGNYHLHNEHVSLPGYYIGPWLQTNETTEPLSIELSLPVPPTGDDYTITVFAAISFGKRKGTGYEAVKGAGCGKVVAVG